MQRARATAILTGWVGSPWIDVALAAGLTVLGQWELHASAHGGLDGMVQGLFMVAQTAPVAVRRTHTVAAASVGSLAMVGEALFATPTSSLAGLLAGLVLAYSVGRHSRGWALLGVSVVILVGLGLHVAALPGSGPLDFAFALLFAGGAWVLGRGSQRRVDVTRANAREAALRETGQEALIASAVAEERARIAREMHDVVAHGMGVMVVQAAAAEFLIEADPQLARKPLATVRQTGQESLAEMHRLLGLLRSGGEPDPHRKPQPTLNQVPELVERLRSAGMPLTLQMDGPEEGWQCRLPAGLGLCAYRIVQESLTNALTHGAGSQTSVVVSRVGETVDLRIHNTRIGQTDGANRPSGNGIVGMRERAEIYSGTLVAGPEPGGGFMVHATLLIPR